ncbi:MAG: methyltransferase type 11 [Candidatus Altiarchaeales archaeon ex4484_96]|nr:MAG: methyltransferase type 11 [Candidatus Altiarchaeales archaeon ex4484_96]
MSSAERFNKKAASPDSKPDEIIKHLDITPGMKIVDLGSGGGYYSFRFAELVGESGRVYAVDTDKVNLDFIRDAAKEKNQLNINTVYSDGINVNLPDKEIDLIYSRNAYHHLTDRSVYFNKLRSSLKARGRIALIDYDGRGSRFSFHMLFNHYTIKQTATDELSKAGYKLIEDYMIFSNQFFLVFE